MSSNGKRVTSWIDPEEVKPIEPNARQKEFQKIVALCAEEAKYTKPEWFAASRDNKMFKKAPLRLAEWDEWIADRRFLKWFFSEIPQAQPIGDYEKQMIETAFWGGIKDGIIDKKEWAYKIFARLRYGHGSAAQQKEDEQQFKAFLGDVQSSRAWKGEIPEA
jgi:hypothetical protein